MNATVDVRNVRLETKRLILRPIQMEDVEDFYEYSKVDGVGQMAGWNPHSSIKESKQILASFLSSGNVFAVELKENHKMIGTVGLERLTIQMDATYEHQVGREIGYVLSKTYWGQGLMPEAVKRVIQYCFQTEDYDFLLCSHFIANDQSKRVIEKCGFEFFTEHEGKAISGGKRLLRYYLLQNPKQDIRKEQVNLIRASLRDAKLIWKLQIDAFADLYAKYQDAETSPGNESMEKTIARLEQPFTYFYLITYQDTVVGAIRIVDEKTTDRYKHISPLFVLKQYRNKHIAQTAILEAEKLHGESGWMLDTVESEAGNCHLYEKMGYRLTGEKEVINDKLTLVFYQK